MESALEFFENCKKNKTVLKAFLSTGTMLSGKITSYDSETVTLEKCLINFKHLVSLSPRD